MWYLGVAVVCGATASLILTAKGFDWWIGMLLGVFGPFGVIFAIVARRDRSGASLPPPPTGLRWGARPNSSSRATAVERAAVDGRRQRRGHCRRRSASLTTPRDSGDVSPAVAVRR